MNGKLRTMRVAKSSAALDVGSDENDLTNSTEMFRGFVGGKAFITKKGYRGSSLDSIWVQNLFKAFDLDDEELAAIALKSSLADLHDLVIGGEYGTPYSIGDHGFYASSQFNEQASLLKETERLNSDQKFFLSENEWGVIDRYLTKVATFSNCSFDKVCPGDSFTVLAVKKNAFSVATLLLKLGVDPLIENEESDDLYLILKQRYQDITVKVKELSVEMVKLQLENKVVRNEWEKMEALEQSYISALEGLLELLSEVKGNLEVRLSRIEIDKKILRRAELLNQTVNDSVLWNIAQEEKILSYLKDIPVFEGFVTEKIFLYKQQQKKRKDDVVIMRKKNKHVLHILAAQNLMLDSDSPRDKEIQMSQEETDSVQGSGKISFSSDNSSESRKLDKAIMAELMALTGDSLDADETKKKANSINSDGKDSKGYKPILGTLKMTGDTIISYR